MKLDTLLHLLSSGALTGGIQNWNGRIHDAVLYKDRVLTDVERQMLLFREWVP